MKQLAVATPHERHRGKTDPWQPQDGPEHRYPTIGYSAAAQSPNGMIHLMSSMNHPSLHFEMNEAWILSGETAEIAVDTGSASGSSAGIPVTTHEERYPDGSLRMAWGSRVGVNGRYVLDGVETWYYAGGTKQYEATYDYGRKIGAETLWDEAGNKKWSWERGKDGGGTWIQYWPNGQKRIESHWVGVTAEGPATQWDREGHVVKAVSFKGGALQE
ncbi:MAG: hypothetical protein HZB26_07870 [Candidatus Hydrogenedentes bacterium]|nr:hypothetical protein [Candidatus Hydrogenedentota bacterium]